MRDDPCARRVLGDHGRSELITLIDEFAIGGGAIADEGRLDRSLGAKGSHKVGVCIPARNEATTIQRVVGVARRLQVAGLVDELVVVDDSSTDETASLAHASGAIVVANPHGPGKGQALSRAIEATTADVLVFLDADVENFAAAFITQLVVPLFDHPQLQLVKAAYRRPLDGRPGEGGRVTELVARPLLRRFFPELAAVRQPLAGECAIRRSALDDLTLDDGYAVEAGVLIDIYRRHGIGAIAQADLGERVHRNRPLAELRPHADAVLDAVLSRAGQ